MSLTTLPDEIHQQEYRQESNRPKYHGASRVGARKRPLDPAVAVDNPDDLTNEMQNPAPGPLIEGDDDAPATADHTGQEAPVNPVGIQIG